MFVTTLSEIETGEKCEALQKLMAPIAPTLSALRESRQALISRKHEPPNKNMIHQRRLYATHKNKTNKRKRLSKPYNNEFNVVALSLLNPSNIN